MFACIKGKKSKQCPPPAYTALPPQTSDEKRDPIYPSTPDIPISTIDAFNRAYKADPSNVLPGAVLLENSLSVLQKHTPPNFTFSHTLPLHPVTNQSRSGRCWLFAASNLIRRLVIPTLGLDPAFQISQKYFYFYDTLEKCNWALEADQSLNREILAGISDGGQWSMFKNVLEKYGSVPYSIYPDSYHSLNTTELKRIINSRVRLYKKLLTLPENKGKKCEYLAEIYKILSSLLGQPPTAFKWEYYSTIPSNPVLALLPRQSSTNATKPSHYHSHNLTPQTFTSLILSKPYIPSLISLVNDPRNPYSRVLAVPALGNIIASSNPVIYLNTTISQMMQLTVKKLLRGEPVWFGCDVGKEFDKLRGGMSGGLLTVEDEVFGSVDGVKLGKGDRLKYGESQMTHAMLFVGVHVEEGEAVRFLVENSWGTQAGGYFTMSREWFEEWVYQVVVDVDMLSQEMKDELEHGVRIELPLWDPMYFVIRMYLF